MSTSLSASVSLKVLAALQNTMDVGAAQYPLSYTVNEIFSDGTGADQAKEVFCDTRTLPASGTEDLDLAGGVNDAFGNAITFTKVKALLIKAADGNTNDVVVGGAAGNALASLFGDATDKIKVKPGGTLLLVAPDASGYAVTAGTGDLLTVANSAGGTGVTYTIVVIGVV